MVEDQTLDVGIIINRQIFAVCAHTPGSAQSRPESGFRGQAALFALRVCGQLHEPPLDQPAGDGLGVGLLHIGVAHTGHDIPGKLRQADRRLGQTDGPHPGPVYDEGRPLPFAHHAAIGDDLVQDPGNIVQTPADAHIVQYRILRHLPVCDGIDAPGELLQIHLRPLHSLQLRHGKPLLFLIFFIIPKELINAIVFSGLFRYNREKSNH